MKLTLQTIPSTLISEILLMGDFDGIVLDTEHGCFNNETLYSCIQVITNIGKKCFVRVTDFNKRLVRMCLDAGVDGLIFSTIEDCEIAEEIVRYCNYPVAGGNRGMGLVRQNSWGNTVLDDCRPILIAQIETKLGIFNLDKLSSSGFDYFVLGPYDLSSDLGCAAQWENSTYKLHVETMCDIIHKENLGVFLPTVEQIRQSPDILDKFSLVVYGMDTDFLRNGMGSLNEFFSRQS